MSRFTRLFAFVLVALLASCGGGGSDPPAPVVRVQIEQTAALLTQVGASKQLSAVAYDAQDHVVDAPIAWRSNTPAEIAVDAAGKITAQVASGSAQIVAEAGGISSAPLLAVATALPAGAVALTDAQIVGEPTATDPNAAPNFANTYQVVLRGVATPEVGALLVNTDSKAVGGRVVAVQSAGSQSIVTLQLVSLREMFPGLNIRQTLDLSRAAVDIDPQIAAGYDVQRNGNTLSFAPRPGTSGAAPRAAARSQRARPHAGDGEFRLGPFECESTVTGLNALPIQFSQPPVFSLTQDLALDLVITSAGLERLVARGSVGVAYDSTTEISVAFVGTIECEKEIFAIRLPVGGPLSLVIGGVVPIKLGFEAGGQLTLATAKLGLTASASAEAQLGMACPGGQSCEFVRSLTGTGEVKPNFQVPTIDGEVRFEPELTIFGKVELALGNPFLRAIRFNAFEASMGPKLAGSFAPLPDQIAGRDYKSSYERTFEAKAGLGSTLDDALELLGIDRLDAVELSGSVRLNTSPQGAVTADRLAFVAGEQVNFRVEFDAATLNFLPLIYNVREVVLMRTPPGTTEAREVARSTAASGQRRFDFAFTAADSGSAAEFTAFVVTTLLPLDVLALEVGAATAWAVDVQMPSTFQGETPIALTATVTRLDEQGATVPVADAYVALSSTCGSLNPTAGRTDAQGRLAASLTPSGCSAAVSVTALASESEGSEPKARKTVTAMMGTAEVERLDIWVGGDAPSTPGHILVTGYRSDDSDFRTSVPIAEVGSLQALVDSLLAGSSRIQRGVRVLVSEAVALSLTLGRPAEGVSVSSLTAAACASNIGLSVGNVQSAVVRGCLGRVALTTGDAGSISVDGARDTAVTISSGKAESVSVGPGVSEPASGMIVNVSVGGYGYLQVRGTANSVVNVHGTLAAPSEESRGLLDISGNSNLELGSITGGAIGSSLVSSNSFASPPSIALGNIDNGFNIGANTGLSGGSFTVGDVGDAGITGNTGLSLDSITMGNVRYSLTIRDNRGFSDEDAEAFARQRSVGGSATIEGNEP